jgi:hypothetical protein
MKGHIMSLFGNLMRSLKMKDMDDAEDQDFSSRRAFPRRSADKCVGFINGKPMPILDWSPGGARVFGDTRTVRLGQDVDVMLKFHLDNQLVDIQHRAMVVRKGSENFAVQFYPLPKDIRTSFQHIIDNFNAMDFANSQS